MAKKNLMGFKKVTGPIPSIVTRDVRHGIYEPLVREVYESGDTYMLDTADDKRAISLVGTLRTNVKRLGLDGVIVKKRGTKVYITKVNADADA